MKKFLRSLALVAALAGASIVLVHCGFGTSPSTPTPPPTGP